MLVYRICSNITCLQERQRKREAPLPPEEAFLSKDAAAENTAAMAVAAVEVAAATAQAQAAVPGSDEHKTAEVRQSFCCILLAACCYAMFIHSMIS